MSAEVASETGRKEVSLPKSSKTTGSAMQQMTQAIWVQVLIFPSIFAAITMPLEPETTRRIEVTASSRKITIRNAQKKTCAKSLSEYADCHGIWYTNFAECRC